MKNKTLDYYNQNAEEYIKQTRDVNMNDLYDVFTNNLPFDLGIPQNILDVGCGSGRDSFYFSNKLGMKVTAIDGSIELIKTAQEIYELSDITWLTMKFNEISNQEWENQFTGIWACASLLHIPFNDLAEIMTTLLKALMPHGVMYASFKYGNDERLDGIRFFNDMNEDRLLSVLHQLRIDCTIEYDCWLTTDQRQDRDDEWFNVLIEKKQIL